MNNLLDRIMVRNFDFETYEQYNLDKENYLNFYHVIVDDRAIQTFLSMLDKNIIFPNYLNFYHVITDDRAIQTFLSTLDKSIIFPFLYRWKNEHVHLIVWSRKVLHSFLNIQSESIKNEKHIRYIMKKFFNSSEEQHNFVCNFTSKIPSLKDLCMEKILYCLDYLHNMEKLKLPRELLKDLFFKSWSNFYLPGLNNKSYKLKLNYPLDEELVFEKDYVVWFQNTKNFKISFSCIKLEFFTDKSFKMCLKCMKFLMGNTDYKCIYTFYSSDVNYYRPFIQNPMNWCHACKQSPLFRLYGKYYFTRNRLYRKFFIDDSCQMVEYYKNGIKCEDENNSNCCKIQ